MTNYTKSDFQFGDIIATRSNKFLSRAIRFFMQLYRPVSQPFSHIAVVINVWGEIWIAEALAWGVRIYPIEQSGYLEKEQVIILRHGLGFTEDQIKALSKKCISLGGIRYQYENLLQWIGKILFKRRSFHKEGERTIYCSELGAVALNEAFPGTFPKPNETSPADHYFNMIYRTIDKNHLL